MRLLGAGDTKKYWRGTHRVVDPAETFARTKAFWPEFGITRVANVTGLDTVGIPVVMVVRPNSRSLSVSQGKALDLVGAKASGVMESIELYHAENIEGRLIYGSFADVASKHRVVNWRQLPKAATGEFSENRPVLWIEGVDIGLGQSVFVPFETVNMNWCLPLPPGAGAFLSTSNGLASGNTLSEAVSHGICELVERDAAAIVSASKTLPSELDLSTVDDADCASALARFRSAKIDVFAFDCTSDVGIPTFGCLISDASKADVTHQRFATGYGCHLDKGIALLRALTEAAQSRLTLIAGSRDDIAKRSYQSGLIAQPPTDNGSPIKSFAGIEAAGDGHSLLEDVRIQLERLRGIGCNEVIAVDLSREGYPFNVVRMIIPGLEGMHTAPAYRRGSRASRASDA